MHWAIDCDDVVVDFFARVVECYNHEFNEQVVVSDIKGWDDNPIKKSKHFGFGSMFPDWWDWWRARETLWSDCDAIKGSLGGLFELHSRGHYIELLTSKPLWSRKWFFKWLYEWNPYFDQLTLVEEVTGQSKLKVSDAEAILDDKPTTVVEWAAYGRAAILFDQPWNQDVQCDKSPGRGYIYRVKSWAEVIDVAKELELQGVTA